jgi:hypothetical protein
MLEPIRPLKQLPALANGPLKTTIGQLRYIEGVGVCFCVAHVAYMAWLLTRFHEWSSRPKLKVAHYRPAADQHRPARTRVLISDERRHVQVARAARLRWYDDAGTLLSARPLESDDGSSR